MALYTITHRLSRAVLFSVEAESLRLALEAASKTGANLQYANLQDANLYGARLPWKSYESSPPHEWLFSRLSNAKVQRTPPSA